MTDDPDDAAHVEATAEQDAKLRARALGAGLAMLVVALTYDASFLGDESRWWASCVALVLGVLLADGLVAIRSMLPIPGLAPLTLLATTFVATLCVPETDQLPLVSLLPAALVFGEVGAKRQFPIEWYVVSATAIGWGAMYGATGRQSALAGALFAWWTILLPAAAARLGPMTEIWRPITITAVAAVSAGMFARTGGIADRNAEIVIAFVACLVVSAVLAMWIARSTVTPGVRPPV